MQDLLEIFGQAWAIRALLASVMVGIMCGILGCFIVLRNMALIGDALSHAILPGIVVAFILFGYSTLGFFVGSVIAGLIAAVGITWIQQKIKTKNDAAIGIVFTAMFAIGVIGISWISKEQGVHLDLKDFLFGNVLGVSDQDLYLTFGITVYVIISVIVFYRYLFISTFQPVIAEAMGISTTLIHYFIMLLLSFAVVASLRTVGVILVVAMLITPASTALLISDRLKRVIWISALVGMLSAILGLLAAIQFETTPGPAMAVVATLIYLATALFSPKKGIFLSMIKKRKLLKRIRLEDILKQAFRLNRNGVVQIAQLDEHLEIDKNKLSKYLSELQTKDFLKKSNREITLSEKGILEANRLIRAHRLWETYLVDQIGLSEEQIHEEAEKYEHLLTADILDEVDEKLGYPTTDPHGSPIPTKKGKPPKSLWQITLGDLTTISNVQSNDMIAADLWKLGLLPGTDVRLLSKTDFRLVLQVDESEITINKSLADKISTQ